MANVAATNITFFKPFLQHYSNFPSSFFNISIPIPNHYHKPTSTKCLSRCHLSVTPEPSRGAPETFVSQFAADQPRKGSDILVEALEREGVTHVFGYPGGASMEIHEALARSSMIRNVLPRHEQGGIFAADGYARASGRPGVPRGLMGTDAFQEVPLIDITRPITKFNYLVLDVEDIPRTVKEAFLLATSGRPGPVLIDIPRDIQKELVVPNWNKPIMLPGNASRLPKLPEKAHLEEIVRLISVSKRPVVYAGGGCMNCSEELRRFVGLTGIPVASTLMGLGIFACTDDLSLHMLGMHGTIQANYAVDRSDLLLAFGVRFDDRVTGKVEAFARNATIVHIDIDPAEIGKNKKPHLSICTDVKLALEGINTILEKNAAKQPTAENKRGKGTKFNDNVSAWIEEIDEQKEKYPASYKTFGEAIPPQYAIQLLDELTNGNAIICTGVGQHQMWAAQYYKHKNPRHWLSSSGLGAMGFGLPAAMGAALAKPDAIVVDIDGDGSFMMNIQELATIRVENLPVKIMLLNNQHLGMVYQYEYEYGDGDSLHSYMGNPSNQAQVFPDMLMFAEACNITAARVTKKAELREAIEKMLKTPGPYLLDVMVPHQAQVLQLIPDGGTFKDAIKGAQ
ncbi:Acetolactate synthase 2, chloroplastic [Vitis vinifera]|uniref:acetolactate synthase n=3 Tax=Vitis vinifera TaxID=29760 RepID=A0A438DXN4_VITVI|nr:Acetolactate synthase 2, chloroplastic [Vitis vinifera]